MRKEHSIEELTSEVVEALDGESVDTEKYDIASRFKSIWNMVCLRAVLRRLSFQILFVPKVWRLSYCDIGGLRVLED